MNVTTAPTTAKETAHKQPKLGVDACDACGRSTAIVGPLSTESGWKGMCRYCEHGIVRYEIVAAELVGIMRAWWLACIERGFTQSEIEDTVDDAAQQLAIWASTNTTKEATA